MNWFRQNRFLGGFLIALAAGLLMMLVLLWITKSRFDSTSDQFNQSAAELDRLERLDPFPNDTNLLAMKTQAADFGATIGKLKQELKARVLPAPALAPNEFQAQLRRAVTAVTARAAANHVKLPDNFFLGFDEFSTALPSNALAPLLGQQLAQVELLVDIMIDARIDALTAFHRGSLAPERTATPTPAPRHGRSSLTSDAKEKDLVGSSHIEATFVASPSALRLCLNQIAAAKSQFFLIRTLHVLNEKDKGPPRGQASPAPAPIPAASPAKAVEVLNFIVGNEHVQTSADIELVEFNF